MSRTEHGVGMREVPLTKGMVAVVDDEDLPLVSQFSWCASQNTKKGGKGYFHVVAKSKAADGKRITVRMHRLLMGALPGQEVDHIDGNPLNNTRRNLRLCSRAQNCQNKRSGRSPSSGFRGVAPSGKNSYIASIGQRVGGKFSRKYLGSFSSAEEAARAYDAAARELHGEFAVTNFSISEGSSADGDY